MSESRPRYVGLDGLRGFAALVVLLYHVQASAGLDFGMQHGYAMVDLFFVISGFVLTAKYGDFSLPTRSFLLVRFARLYPLHLVTLAFLAIAEVALWYGLHRHAVIETDMWWTLFLNLFLLQCVGLTRTPSWNTSSWSISVEFWLNYAWYIAGRFGTLKTATPYLLIWVIALAILASHTSTIDAHMETYSYVGAGLLRGLIGISAGSLIYKARSTFHRHTFLLDLIIVIAAGALFALSSASLLDPNIAAFAFAVLAAPLLVAQAASQKSFIGRAFSLGPLQYLGAISYSIYLWHLLIIKIVNISVKGNSELRGVLMILMTLVVAAASHRYIEMQGRGFVLGWFGRRPNQTATA